MRAFFTFNVSFGIKSLPETRMYCLKDNFVGVPTVQKVMPRNYFEKIRQYLCLNMLPQDDPAYDKLFKMRPLLDRLASTFCKECQPSKFISIDEGMVKYKGRLGFQQYLLMKPMKWGIKVWVRANAINGFVSTMQVYMGKKDASQPEHSLGHYVVCNLLSDLKGKKIITSFAITFSLQFNRLKICCPTNSIFAEVRVPKEMNFVKT